eukprot:363488-Chlamydomonas_euryale.AAC.12
MTKAVPGASDFCPAEGCRRSFTASARPKLLLLSARRHSARRSRFEAAPRNQSFFCVSVWGGVLPQEGQRAVMNVLGTAVHP